jgi:hypothetical protein
MVPGPRRQALGGREKACADAAPAPRGDHAELLDEGGAFDSAGDRIASVPADEDVPDRLVAFPGDEENPFTPALIGEAAIYLLRPQDAEDRVAVASLHRANVDGGLPGIWLWHHAGGTPSTSRRASSSGEETTMTVFFERDGHCSLRFRSGPPATVVGTLAMNRYDGARLPYLVDGACVLIDDRLVPVLPEGWTLRGHRESATVALIDPAGVTVANDGDPVWLNGTVTDTERPFDCDLGQLFEVSEVVMAERVPG